MIIWKYFCSHVPRQQTLIVDKFQLIAFRAHES